MMYGSWDVECVMDRIFLDHFLPFYLPLTTQKIKILKKFKKTWRYHFSHVYYKWQSYDDVWFLRYRAQWTVFLAFWTIFCAFIPLTTQKIKIWKNEKNILLEILSFYTCTINENHMMYSSWDRSVTDIIFCHFRPFFAILPPNNPKN